MTKSELESKRIATAARLNTIAGLEGDAFTDAIRAEAATLEVEFRDSGLKLSALLATEDEERQIAEREAAALGSITGDPETRERLELRSKSSLIPYVKAAVEMRSVSDGPEAEYNSALGMGADAFPLQMLAPTEARQTTTADVAVNQQGTWLDRLFDQTAAARLGVSFKSVGAGVASFPTTTAGATAAQLDKSGAVSAAGWTVGIVEMRPKRNAVHAIFSIEDVARIGPGLEAALQRDLRSALTEGIDRAIFLGDATPTAAAADIVGLQTAAIAEVTLTQANKILAPQILAKLASFIDGKHAISPADLRIVASVGSNVLWMTTIQAAAVENQTVAQFLRDSGISWTTRGGIDTNTANGDFGAYVGLGQGIDGAAVSAHWMAGSLIRDNFSGSTKGEVSLVLNTLHDFAIPRPSNFRRLKYVT